MRFTLPVQEACEVSVLKTHGADELYCGYLDDAWRRNYSGDAVISRRQGRANLSSPQALEALAREARRCGVPVHLALNGRVTRDQIPLLQQIAETWASVGGTGIILQDPELLRILRPAVSLTWTVSLLAVTVNRGGAAFWRGLGADRLVLPRFLSPAEMKAVTSSAPDLLFEAMVMGDHCPFIDGFCRSVHAESFQPAPPEAPFSAVLETCHTDGHAYHLCGDLCSPVPDPCAACRLAELASCGISFGKLGGRGLPLSVRLQWLDFLQRAAAASVSSLPAAYRKTFGHECHCYYPEGAEK